MKLFTRIFLSFWLTVIVVNGITITLIVHSALTQPAHPRVAPIFPIHLCALATLDEYERGGTSAVAQYLTSIRATGSCPDGVLSIQRRPQIANLEPGLATVEKASGQQLPKDAAVSVKELPFHTLVAFPSGFRSSEPSIFLFAHSSSYALLVNSSFTPYRLLAFLLSRIVLLASVSGVCCYVLTLYLVKPVTRLGKMAMRLGEGHLGTRIDGPLTTRTDEFGELGRRFNQMAGEIESSVTRYKHFLAHASHELGSPLTRVNMALALAREKAVPSLQPELDRIGFETRRLNTLVQELLLLARLESGNELGRQTTSFDVAQVVDEACADANFEAVQCNKSIILQRRQSFYILGHQELLRRSLDNVLRNGLRFAQEGGSIQVEMEVGDDGKVGIISVQDDGAGIASDQEELIFEPFVTFPDRVTGANEGSGLGLAIARQAILANGGTIYARNSEKGGLRIVIQLPTSLADKESTP